MLCRTLNACGWAHPDEMLAEMPARWFEDWLAAYNADPWGEERADLRAARQTWATLQVSSRKRLRERDYLLKFSNNTTATNVALYRQKAAQRYLLHNAAWDRKERRQTT